MRINLRPDQYAVCRLPANAAPPPRPPGGDLLFSITWTAEEMSVVCPAELTPPGAKVASQWRCLSLQGPLDMETVGILSSLSATLAGAGIPVFVLCTYDTDHILVGSAHLARALEALRSAGHEVGVRVRRALR